MNPSLKQVLFVKAKEASNQNLMLERTEGNKQKCRAESSVSSSGSEIRTFYEDIVGLNESKPTTCSEEKHRQKRKGSQDVIKASAKKIHTKTRAEVDQDIRLSKGANDFLRCAQDGDFETLKRHLKRGIDINCQDEYGWTAIMCSAYAGKKDVLIYLLENNANVYLVDNQGNSAIDVVSQRKKEECKICYKVLRKFMDGESNWQMRETQGISLIQPYFCIECNATFSDMPKEKHLTSTLHLFNTKPHTRSTMYHLTESNKGFQMLVQSGWDKERGLGPEGKGNKFPVKTVLKRNREGLGNPSTSKAKVTHFNAYDTTAVQKETKKVTEGRKLKQSTLSKRDRAKKLTKEQEKEREFRLAFNTDI